MTNLNICYVIEDLAQGTDEWHKWRGTKVTATDSVVILDKSPHKTRYILWGEKTGLFEPTDLSRNPHVRRGVREEDPIRQVIEDQIDDLLFPNCVTSKDFPLFAASLDGLDSNGIPHEIKSPSETTFTDVMILGKSSSAYELYYTQVQHQILVTGAPHGYLHFGFRRNEQGAFTIKSFKINRDDALIAQIIDEGKKFREMIETNTPPAKDASRDDYVPTGEDARKWKTLAREYRQIQRKVDELKASMEPMEQRLKDLQQQGNEMMGTYKAGDYAGLRLTRVERAGSTSYADAFKEWTKNEDPAAVSAFLADFKGNSSTHFRATVDLEFADSPVPVQTTVQSSVQPNHNSSHHALAVGAEVLDFGDDWID